jgi:hypothetical protein
MEAKKAMTPVAAAAAKRLIRRSGGWLHTQCSTEISLFEIGDALAGAERLTDDEQKPSFRRASCVDTLT